MAAPQQQQQQQLLSLFDSFWFEHEILTSKFPKTSISPNQLEPPQNPKLSRTPTFIPRSFSDQCLSSKDSLEDSSEIASPNSVLLQSKLKPILSGKEYIGFPEQETVKDSNFIIPDLGFKNRDSYRRMRKMKGSNGNSKSLSELEFKELKGFMDLGFVFSDKDRDSILVSIIPGLQRIGRESEEKPGIEESGIVAVSRPYLSEAWDVMEEENMKNYNNPLVNWRIPDFGSEMEMKNHLRNWAHTVAGTCS